jgi:hypothetical protein
MARSWKARASSFDVAGVVPAGKRVRQEDCDAMRLVRRRPKFIEQTFRK